MRYLFVLLVLAGCVTPEQMAAQREQEAQMHRAAQEVYKAKVYGQCRSYGFQEGTDGFRKCLMQVDQANQAQNAQMRQMLIQQMIQQQQADRPFCSSLPAGIAGYRRAEGSCR